MTMNIGIAKAILEIGATAAPHGDEGGSLACGIIEQEPGHGMLHAIRKVAEALEATYVEVRTLHVEYHPGAINAVAYDQVEMAVALGKPVIIVLDEAQGAQPCVVEALCSAIGKRVGSRTVLIVGTAWGGDNGFADVRMANGLGWHADHVRVHRIPAGDNRGWDVPGPHAVQRDRPIAQGNRR